MNIKLDGFYGYDEMIEAIRILADAYPDLVEVSSIGTSFEGRDLPLLIISSKEKKHDQKPAYYMQANVHSNEAEGTTVCLYFAQKICSDPQYRDLLNDMAFYIVPRVNPDGAELAVKQKYVVRSRATVHYVKDHIIPKDINGDGKILKMRIRCDDGNMKPHPDDPRYMVPRKSDDTEGPFYKVYTEGIIHDYSGGEFYNPQSTVVDFNRNYPVYWQPNNPLAGKYPLSEQEIKSVADFLLSRPNIFAGIDIHNGSNAVFRPGSLPDDFYDKEDLYDYGVYLRLRYQTQVQRRAEISYNINKMIFQEFQNNPNVDMAIPYIYSSKAGAERKEADASKHKSMPHIQDIDMSHIQEPDLKVDYAELEPIIESISTQGLLQPILLNRNPIKGTYEILAGHLRYEACKRLGWRTIPAIIQGEKSDIRDSKEH
jgi:hypothetical protein